jgi:AraC-like DNA-binding protein
VLELRPTIEWGPAARFATDAVLGCLVVILQSVVGRLPAGTCLELPDQRPVWAERYARLGFAQVRFGQKLLALHFPSVALALPCLGADARAHAAACRECELALAELQSKTLTHRIAGMLAGVNGGRFPSLTECATQLHLTPRTLIRRLGAEGSAYQILLDDERRTRARWLIESTQRGMEDIATELGFASASNFGRTVRRWFGCSPTALRRAAAIGAVPPAPTLK